MMGFLRKNVIPLVIVILLAIEGLTFHFMLPSDSPPADAQTQTASSESERIEIPLGDYKVRNHQNPADDHIVKFSVCLMTDLVSEKILQGALKEHEQKAREAVSTVARRAKPEILGEPTLATLKRRISVAIKSAIRQTEGPEFDVLLPDFLVQKG
jgi:flagellar basal body-associated protein FliL